MMVESFEIFGARKAVWRQKMEGYGFGPTFFTS
jgi:hypothetical protein